ncbi:MAG: phage tail tube protein [Thermodesulfobacteriota bacterium]|nr:MAG: phage tail tube protein [Thermodesulfobacteriota bacterium]
MARNLIYAALGEEAERGIKESGTVGFLPLLSPVVPKSEFDDRKRKEWRGEEAALGPRAVERFSERWSASLDMPFFTEASPAKGMVGTLLKHFFGKSASGQNGSTGQYYHMMCPAADPFSESLLGHKALTLNFNINEGANVRNWPFVGGRVKALTFEQEAGQALKLSAEIFGQRRDADTVELGSPVFAAENLRCDYNNLSISTGLISRTGTAPDFTGFSAAGATAIRPDKVSIKVENGMEDALRLSGAAYPDRTRMGEFKVSVELVIDWEDPSNGFSSIAEFREWVSGAGTTNLFFHWDTCTTAGTGGTHGLIIDLPRLHRTGGEPEYSREKDPMVTLKYEGLFDGAEARYMMGLMLINTAPTV